MLYFLEKGYGYDLYKTYLKVFGRVSLRSIYYHLNKGKELGEFMVSEIKIVEGDYLKEKFSKSYQEGYIQLINSELIEKGI